MIGVLEKGKQICYKCKASKPIEDFYQSGNLFMNCSACRKQRVAKKTKIKMLLQKDQQLRKEGILRK